MIRSRLTYANVMATLAVVIAVGTGGAYAVGQLGSGEIKRNAIRTKHIKKGNVRASDLGAGAVTSAAVADGSLLGTDFAAGQLPAGSEGPQGPEGPAGPPRRSPVTLSGLDFRPIVTTMPVTYNASGRLQWDSSDGLVYAQLSLPDDAQIEGFELIGRDIDDTGDLAALLITNRPDVPAGEQSFIGSGVSTGEGAAPGFGEFGSPTNVTPPVAVDNANRTYMMLVSGEVTAPPGEIVLAGVQVHFSVP